MQETFGIGAFRSRQQVMRFDGALRRAGIASQIISTPREISIGCGLSVQFDLRDAADVLAVYRRSQPGNLIGFYQVTRTGNAQPLIEPLIKR